MHFCVDAQTGLGTTPPRPYCENMGTATTDSHRAGKWRLLEIFIMENMLTATNTLDREEDGIKRNFFRLVTTMGNTNRNRLTPSSHLTDA